MILDEFKRSHANHCLYKNKGCRWEPRHFGAHVDDILIDGKSRVLIMTRRLTEFGICHKWFRPLHILSLRIMRDKQQWQLYVVQIHLKVLKRSNMNDAKTSSVPLSSHVHWVKMIAQKYDTTIFSMNVIPSVNLWFIDVCHCCYRNGHWTCTKIC